RLLHQKPAPAVEMPEKSPTKADIFFERAIDFGDPILFGVDQQMSLHPSKHLFHMRRRFVVGIGTKVQSDQLVSGRSNANSSLLCADPLIKNCMRKCFYDPL